LQYAVKVSLTLPIFSGIWCVERQPSEAASIDHSLSNTGNCCFARANKFYTAPMPKNVNADNFVGTMSQAPKLSGSLGIKTHYFISAKALRNSQCLTTSV
jgi:hypothetical protein